MGEKRPRIATHARQPRVNNGDVSEQQNDRLRPCRTNGETNPDKDCEKTEEEKE
jgi:hypothetical protein